MSNEVEITIKSTNRARSGFREAERDAKRTSHTIELEFDRVGKRALGVAKNVASFGASIAAVGSLAGPALSALLAIGKGIAAIGTGIATAAPALATLPMIGAGFLLIKTYATSAFAAIGEAGAPISSMFGRLRDRVGDLADNGVGKLANQFVKLNWPVLSEGADMVAKSINRIVLAVGNWINSKPGLDAIHILSISTGIAMQKLEGPVSRVAIAFGNMVERIGGQDLIAASSAMGRLADKTAEFLDQISREDVDEALNALQGWGQKIKETFIVLRDIGNWMQENEGKVKAFSDTLAGAAVTIGIATGNIPAILAGSFTLVANHWEDLKGLLSEVGPFFSGIWDAVKNDPNVQGIFDSIKIGLDGFRDSFNKATEELGPKWNEFVSNLKKAWDEWGPIIKAWWDGVGRPVLSAMGTMVGEFFTNLVMWAGIGASALDFLGEVFRALWRIVSDQFSLILAGAVRAFGWIPGIGDKLRSAQRDFESFRDRVNSALNGIHDKTVSVTIEYHYKTFGKPGTEVGGIGGMAFKGLAHGGITGAAGGGPRSNWTMVGEQGRELVKLPPGSQVMPHGQSENMAAASGGGGGGMELYWKSTGDKLLDTIIQGIGVRIRTDQATSDLFASAGQ